VPESGCLFDLCYGGDDGIAANGSFLRGLSLYVEGRKLRFSGYGGLDVGRDNGLPVSPGKIYYLRRPSAHPGSIEMVIFDLERPARASVIFLQASNLRWASSRPVTECWQSRPTLEVPMNAWIKRSSTGFAQRLRSRRALPRTIEALPAKADRGAGVAGGQEVPMSRTWRERRCVS
jgi:hypothetical protein